jgi:protein-S-isoprenylcysteine O-methyltransferase Ste14
MHGEYKKSLGPKLANCALHAAALVLAVWLLFGNGFEALGRWTGGTFPAGDPWRNALVFACAAVYFARLCFTGFRLLQRAFGWGEAIGVGLFIACLQIFYAYLAGKNPRPLGVAAFLGAALYLWGSYLNTASEYQRHRWKQRPENRGQLYTEGLFRYAMHINYFGDTMLFTGYALVTGSPWALVIPALMAAGFVFVHIPMLDRYLERKYGAGFEAYARRTKRYVPYLY